MANKETTAHQGFRLAPERLRWRCDPESLGFHSTAEVTPVSGIVGQGSAVEALRFGIECDAPGQNVFVRGISGSGRMTLVKRLLEELRPSCRLKSDRCYVHNFKEPQRPRLISLPAGRAGIFRRRVRRFANFAREGLIEALNADAVLARREAIAKHERDATETITEPFQNSLREAGLALVSIKLGTGAQTAIFPLVDGKPVPPEEFENLYEAGDIEEARYSDYMEKRDSFGQEFAQLGLKIGEIRAQGSKALESLLEGTARAVLSEETALIRAEFSGDDVAVFLREMVEDVVENTLSRGQDPQPIVQDLYDVNVISNHEDGGDCPIVVENTPTLTNLLGSAEREWTPTGPAPSSYRMVRAGSLLSADGGYLIIDARDVLGESGAWKALMRTLRSGLLEIVPTDMGASMFQQTLKPEPIPVRLRVILVGDADTYFGLDAYDPDFANQFKVLSDFDSVIERGQDALDQYAGTLARIAEDENLLPFHRTAVAALAEHGARVAAQRGSLTARFARIADIAREAAFLTTKAGGDIVSGVEVLEAIKRTKERANLPARRFQRYLDDGTIHVRTEGRVAGQINGLAVISAGPISYGFPARITATIGPGHAGIIDIEGRALLSGSIHTKGFQILGGLLRHLLQTEHPLSFSASLAFEQSYGGIDGDSASGAEIVCLLSALTGVPIRQDLAMTGAIDQFGRIQAIGGANEKIEGFFDTCRGIGLTGTQGVLIPRSNADDLMLRIDVVEACAEGRFSIYAIETIEEALEMFSGVPAGERGEDGLFPEGTLLRIAVDQAGEYWSKTLQSPATFFEVIDDEEEEEEVEEVEEVEGAEQQAEVETGESQ